MPAIKSALFVGAAWGWNQQSGVLGPGIPPPRPSTAMWPSACQNGGQTDGPRAYACPHHMLFSPDLLHAAAFDGLDDWAVYAIAGGSDDSLCGSCWQVQPLDAETQWSDALGSARLIVQVANSGFDVLSGQLDLFMGAGGFGYFTACNADCAERYCQGGPCFAGMYDGSFASWTEAQFADPNPCYSGGIKRRDGNRTELARLCGALTSEKDAYNHRVLVQSCVESNMHGYHQNFVSSNRRRVACPEGLVRATGMRRADDGQYPRPDVHLDLPETCRGDRTQGHYCITTMQDCCVPSCAWPGKVAVDPQWPRIDTCGAKGLPL